MPLLSVPFTNSSQEKTFWCWAAVAANVYNSMRPPAVPAKSQCDVVTMVQGDCESNQPDALSSALTGLGINDKLPTGPRITVIENEFEGIGEKFDPDEGVAEPVCAGLLFPGRAFHFVAISAIDTDIQHVWVADPYIGGNPVEFNFLDFVNNYNYTTDVDETGGTVQNFERVVNKWIGEY